MADLRPNINSRGTTAKRSLRESSMAVVTMPAGMVPIHADRTHRIDLLTRHRISLLDGPDTDTDAAITEAAAVAMTPVGTALIHVDRARLMHRLIKHRINLPGGPADTDTNAAGVSTHPWPSLRTRLSAPYRR